MGIDKVFEFHRPAELARRLGVSLQVVCNWRRREQIPARHVIAVEAITGVPRETMRPDLYPPAAAQIAAK